MRTFAVVMFVALVVTACGKTGPLVYPEMLVPAAPSNVAVQQSGSSIKLSFVLPSKDRAGRNISNLAGITILKRDTMAGQPLGCSACTDDFYLFRKLNLDLLPTDAQRNGSLVLLLDGDVQQGRSYSYIVSAFTSDEEAGAASPPIATAMVQPPSPPVLRSISHPTEIDLEFVGLPLTEGSFAGYNLYRSTKGGVFSFWPLNGAPLKAHHFSDEGMEREITYVYVARTVVRLSTGTLVESAPSNEVQGKLKDDE